MNLDIYFLINNQSRIAHSTYINSLGENDVTDLLDDYIQTTYPEGGEVKEIVIDIAKVSFEYRFIDASGKQTMWRKRELVLVRMSNIHAHLMMDC